MDRVRQCRGGWDDVDLAYASYAEGVARIGYLNDHRIYHGQVETGGHPVVQEAAIGQFASFVVEVLLVKAPADALNRSTLHLALHIARMYGLASVLSDGEPENLHLACFGIDLDVRDAPSERTTDTRWAECRPAHDGAAGIVELRCKLLERHVKLGIGPGPEHSIDHLDGLVRDVPDGGRALNRLLFYVLRRLVSRAAGLECNAAAAGATGVADGIGVGDGGPDVLGPDAQNLGDLHGQRSPAATDIGGALYEVDGSVRVDADGRRGRATTIDPVPDGDASSPVGAVQWSTPVGVVSHRFKSLDQADTRVDDAVGATRAFFSRVHQAELDGIDL